MKNTKKKELKDYENAIEDIDELQGNDIKINPDYYIHSAILKAQSALLMDDSKVGFTKFYLFIEHIEVLARAAGMLLPDYESKLEEYKKELRKHPSKEPLVDKVHIANKKLELIMVAVFSGKTITDPLKA